MNSELQLSCNFTHEECATVLAALRFWQEHLAAGGSVPDRFDHFEDTKPLTVPEIDLLCESINLQPSGANKPYVIVVIHDGNGDIARVRPIGSVDVDILNFDTLEECMKRKEEVVLSDGELAYMQEVYPELLAELIVHKEGDPDPDYLVELLRQELHALKGWHTREKLDPDLREGMGISISKIEYALEPYNEKRSRKRT